jgi:N-acetylneuraminate lyase
MQAVDKFQGIIVAPYAPYDKNGEVDADAAIKQARFYRDRGIKGLYLNGSTGEGFLLSVEERKKIAEAVLGAFKGEMTIIVHVGAIATRDSVELAKHAEKYGAVALAAVPNVYYRLSENSIEYHWNTIIESTGLPFIIYNIPQLTGYDLSLNLLSRMANNKKVIGIKNSSLNAFQTQQFKKAGGNNFIVFNGADEQYLAGRIMGAGAGIGGTYGAMPEMFLKLDDFFCAEDIQEAQKWQVRINEIIMELISFPSLYAAAKGLLKLRGVDIGSVRAPLLPLKEEDMPRLYALHEKVMGYSSEI